MKIRFASCWLAVVFLATSLAAGANQSGPIPTQEILSQQAEIRAEAQARKGRYKDLSQERLTALYRHQDRVSTLLEGREYTTDLKLEDQMAVFNALEAISAIVNEAEDERMVCERVKRVGSNRPQTRCLTVAQRRAERVQTEENMPQRDQQCNRNPVWC